MASSKEEAAGVRPSAAATNLFWFDLPLRSLLFASTVAAVVVMATGKQTKEVTIPGLAPLVLVAKFSYSPSFIYFAVATSVAALYSLVTAIFVWRTNWTARILLYQSFCDAVILGVVASATGAAASIAYVGHNGNSHVGWLKICNMFDEFCRHIGASLVLSAFSSFLLILLVLLSTYSLYLKGR